MAIFALPKEIFPLYKKHLELLVEQSVAPDIRRYRSDSEGPRHFINIDHYCANPDSIQSVLPYTWSAATAKFSEDTLNKYGTNPWQIALTFNQLVEAFKQHNVRKIIRLSSELSHYVSDAHVPLHTTTNYNGQLTKQRGIHRLWETEVPDLSWKNYRLYEIQTKYLESPLQSAWTIVQQSYRAVDSVLLSEKKLNSIFPSDKIGNPEKSGQKRANKYTEEFVKAYELELGGMHERRMRGAIEVTANMWYSAWIDAGQPNIAKLMNQKMQ